MKYRNYRATRRAAAICLAVVLVLVASCAFPLLTPPPLEYEFVTALIGDRGALHTVAGLYHTLWNTSNRDIIELEIGFSLFDDEGAPIPAFGANSFRAVVSYRIPAGGSVSFCTNLDDHVPAEIASLAVSRFRVTTALFADGSFRSSLVHIAAGIPPD